jgi:septal ring factor EnvC (AmiA/AmiB activator)
MRFLIRRDARLVDRYREQRASLAAERSRLAFQREEAVRWATEERAREQDLIAAKGREAALLAQASENRRGLAARAEELLAKERRLAALMGSLMPGAGEGGAGPPLSDYRGLLDWPLRGTVSERFGTRLDPRYGTRIPYNGIEISGPPGTEVAAVFPGKVLFAAPLEGYGPTVVVLHAGRAFTLYAGLERLLVSSEDVLSLGQPVGISAGRLYFEIRLESRAQDPLDWLR